MQNHSVAHSLTLSSVLRFQGSGPHRYAVVLLEQPSRSLDVVEDLLGESDRAKWNLTDWAHEKGLKAVGANWFVVVG